MLDARELVLGLLLLFGTLLALMRAGGQTWRQTLIAAGLLVGLGIASTVRWVRDPIHDAPLPLRMPVESTPEGYIASRSCRSCHPGQYASWHASFHRTMTQQATPEAVLAPFDGEVLSSRNRTYRLFQEQGKFWAEMPDLDFEADLRFRENIDIDQIQEVPTTIRPVAMTTGSHHFQTYWVPGKYGNEVRQLPWVWMIEEQRWIPSEDSFLVAPGGPRHLSIWNNTCIQCHSTAWKPGRQSQRRVLLSEVSEFGIACESCHAGGAEHVAHYQNLVNRYGAHWEGAPGEAIVNPQTISPAASVELCGQCHAVTMPKDMDEWLLNGYLRVSRPGEPLSEARNVLAYDMDRDEEWLETYLREGTRRMEDMFWPDGTVRVGGREYHGIVRSPCYQRGSGPQKMTCLSCHSMHDYVSTNDQLASRAESNQACTQCHEARRFTDELTRHTHHAAESGGSRCYNCHMPHTTYALFQAIRAHRIDIPSVQMSVDHDRPNACNLCHLDRTLAWTADHLEAWYDIAPPKKLSERQQTIAASLLWLLKGNAAQRAIVAWSFGWPEAQKASDPVWMAPFVGQLLNDPYVAVRRIAHLSLKTLPGFAQFEFDFLPQPAQREEVVSHVRQVWSLSSRVAPNADHDTLLLTPDGKLDEASIEDLLQQRDDTPITIAE